MTDRIDLHAHTTCSDGTMTPAELVTHAREVGLAALAITDHDTIAGWIEASDAARALGIEAILGCEITAQLPSGAVHVLAYEMSPGDDALGDLLHGIRRARDERTGEILKRLERLGVGVSREEVDEIAQGPLIARPHIAAALVRRGHVDDVRDAFARYLRDGGPAHVPIEAPSPEVVIERIVDARGVAVLAHPRQIDFGSVARERRVIGRWREIGLAGIEVDHPSHDGTYRARYRDLAAALDLVPSGGSDFHGSNKPNVRLGVGDGTIDVRRETLDRLRERRR